MNHDQTPLEAVQTLLGLIHNAKRAVALSANLAFQLSLTPGPARSVPAALVADALNLLTEQLEDAEQVGTLLEAQLQPDPAAPPADIRALQAGRVAETRDDLLATPVPTATLVRQALDSLHQPPTGASGAAPSAAQGQAPAAADQPAAPLG